MVMTECWLRLLILVSLLWLSRRLWERSVAWVLPRGRCRLPRQLRPRTPHDCPCVGYFQHP